MNDLLRQSIVAVQAGNRAEARRLLTQVVAEDPYSEYAWLWLSAMVETDRQREVCLENVLAINPENAYALAELRELRAQRIRLLPPDSAPVAPVPPQAARRNNVLLFYYIAVGVLFLAVVMGFALRAFLSVYPLLTEGMASRVPPSPPLTVVWADATLGGRYAPSPIPLCEKPGLIPSRGVWIPHDTRLEVYEFREERGAHFFRVAYQGKSGWVSGNLVRFSANLPEPPPAAMPASAPTAQLSMPTPTLAPTPVPAPDGIPDGVAKDRVNVLLLGIDKRPGRGGSWRTDAVILITIDPTNKTVGMLSIPRDLWVTVPGYGENRINTAYAKGESNRYPGGGAALVKETVRYNLGVPVHYYVYLDFEGFREFIDAIGGIDVNVQREIRDDEYPDDNYGYDPLYIPAGPQHMNGDMALKYARTRHGSGDFDRSRRQREVLLAVRDQALRLDLLPRVPELMTTLADNIQTDLQLHQILALAQLAIEIDPHNVKAAAIDGSMTTAHRTETGASVLLPRYDKIRPLIEKMFIPGSQ